MYWRTLPASIRDKVMPASLQLKPGLRSNCSVERRGPRAVVPTRGPWIHMRSDDGRMQTVCS